MGVYVFASEKYPYIKVGHYSKSNAWSRVAHRGFYSCKRPGEMIDVSCDSLSLIAWYPTLTTKHESAIKKIYKEYRIGEWYPISLLRRILDVLESFGVRNEKEACDKEAAKSTRKRL